MPRFLLFILCLAGSCVGKRVQAHKKGLVQQSSAQIDAQATSENVPLQALATLLAVSKPTPAFQSQGKFRAFNLKSDPGAVPGYDSFKLNVKRSREELDKSWLAKVNNGHQASTSSVAQSPEAAALLRLRGGSIVQKVSNAYLGVPLATRSWLSLILAFAGLNQAGILPPEALALEAQATVKGLQLWRPVTAASFLGGLGMQLVQKLMYMVQFGSTLERLLGTGEYLRMLASSTAAMCIACNFLGWPFFGDGLIMAITVLASLQTPDKPMSIYMLTIPCSWYPFSQVVLSYLFTQQIPWQDVVGAFVGYLHYHINDNAKPDPVFYKSKPTQAVSKTSSGGSKVGRVKAQ